MSDVRQPPEKRAPRRRDSTQRAGRTPTPTDERDPGKSAWKHPPEVLERPPAEPAERLPVELVEVRESRLSRTTQELKNAIAVAGLCPSALDAFERILGVCVRRWGASVVVGWYEPGGPLVLARRSTEDGSVPAPELSARIAGAPMNTVDTELTLALAPRRLHALGLSFEGVECGRVWVAFGREGGAAVLEEALPWFGEAVVEALRRAARGSSRPGGAAPAGPLREVSAAALAQPGTVTWMLERHALLAAQFASLELELVGARAGVGVRSAMVAAAEHLEQAQRVADELRRLTWVLAALDRAPQEAAGEVNLTDLVAGVLDLVACAGGRAVHPKGLGALPSVKADEGSVARALLALVREAQAVEFGETVVVEGAQSRSGFSLMVSVTPPPDIEARREPSVSLVAARREMDRWGARIEAARSGGAWRLLFPKSSQG
ncbi:MAG: hypothetical protein HY909_16285 [Deltaproteobacteria bacterium]|nr:hypothetical protein [Deltaproteobacteria bacterium]